MLILSSTVLCSLNVGRLLIRWRYGGGGGIVSYILMFKIVSEILLGKVVCLSLS